MGEHLSAIDTKIFKHTRTLTCLKSALCLCQFTSKSSGLVCSQQ